MLPLPPAGLAIPAMARRKIVLRLRLFAPHSDVWFAIATRQSRPSFIEARRPIKAKRQAWIDFGLAPFGYQGGLTAVRRLWPEDGSRLLGAQFRVDANAS